ncbi:Tail protein [Marinitoga phage MPV1]|uniref:Uncharacterized protein n=1 Tax=Marinitoga piezophila (strain DSM 14283 / JCM 11233 / KA3) TaxID=443254 RepID=H2J4D2_MARPK|nr:hypothetical protein [Marinitoga piezophila]AEX84787.1 hypothetical protein Marpi_0337 [Marinitoga piezophila KA3]
MALIKTPYNLIYNDDGSLCVTLRDDDIPFEGVKSFAVEEGTENLLTYYDGVNDSEFIWEASEGVYYFVGFSFKNLDILNTDNTGNNSHELALSYEYKIDPGTSGYIYSEFYIKWSDGSYNYGSGIYGTIKDGNWHRSSGVKEFPVKPNLSITVYTWRFYFYPSGSTGKVYLRHVQAEDKSFTTSFVNGTRTAGLLEIPINFGNSFVISFWHKTIYGYSQDKTILGLQGNREDGGIDKVINIFHGWNTDMRVGTSENRSKYTIGIFSYTDEDWIFYTIIYDLNSDLFKIYKYNKKTGEFDIDDLSSFLASDNELRFLNFNKIRIGSCFYPETRISGNGKISNLLIAAYDPNIWTDEFIQELYNAKKPFAIPAKMPIV